MKLSEFINVFQSDFRMQLFDDDVQHPILITYASWPGWKPFGDRIIAGIVVPEKNDFIADFTIVLDKEKSDAKKA